MARFRISGFAFSSPFKKRAKKKKTSPGFRFKKAFGALKRSNYPPPPSDSDYRGGF